MKGSISNALGLIGYEVFVMVMFILLYAATPGATDNRGTYWRYDGWHDGAHTLTPMYIPRLEVEQLTEHEPLVEGTTLKCEIIRANVGVGTNVEGKTLLVIESRLVCDEGRVYRIKSWLIEK